ncbi:TMV resistance protein N-like [Dorcoceras hygrometricum]|uniref:TMV resistance protein N-like n=1 Tax=Dorcoceras hygrometricum TaxID=472368 RepID=A0A2Z7C0X1_9LAMI|nr:TMV resistance protein N-like [Dorcoceras hygrometricum]
MKRVGKKRDPWKCEMHWRDNMYTLTPRTPDRSPNLASFLDAMRGNSYNSPELIHEDLQCFFDFSRRGVELVGDLDEQMGKAEMLRLMEEEATAGSSGAAAPSKKATKKRRASTPSEKEARREKKKKEASTSGSRPERIPKEGRVPTPSKHITEDRPKSPPVITIAEAFSLKTKGPGRVPTLDYTQDSLVASPSGVVATSSPSCECNLRSFDEASGQHAELVARLEELEALRAQDQRAAEAHKKELEAQLATEKAAREVTKSELALDKKTAIEIELGETKAHAEEEVGRLKSEAIHAWDLSKEEFL